MTGSEVNWFFNVENVTIVSFGSSPSLSRILSCELEQWCHDDGKIFCVFGKNCTGLQIIKLFSCTDSIVR
jgi:hypothetical protein